MISQRDQPGHSGSSALFRLDRSFHPPGLVRRTCTRSSLEPLFDLLTPGAARTTEARNFARDFDFARSSASVVETFQASPLGIPRSLFADPDHLPMYGLCMDYSSVQRILIVAGHPRIACKRRETDHPRHFPDSSWLVPFLVSDVFLLNSATLLALSI